MLNLFEWFKHKASMKIKMQISFVIVCLVPLVGLGGYTYVSSRSYIINQTKISLTNNAETIAYGLDNNVRRIEAVIDFLSYSSEFRKKLENINLAHSELAKELTENIEPEIWYYISSDSNISTIHIYSTLVSHSIGSFLSHPTTEDELEWYEICGEDYTTHWAIGQDGEIYVYKALMDNSTASRRIGMIVLQVQTSNFLALLNQTQYMNNGAIVIGDDTVFAIKETNNINSDDILELINAGKASEYVLGSKYAIAPSNYTSNGWRVYYYIRKKDVSILVQRQLYITIGITLGSFIILYVISTLLAKGLSKRIMALQEIASGVSKGMFDIPHNESYTDELGQVEKSFSIMGRRILDMMKELDEQRAKDVDAKNKVIIQREWVFDYMVEKNNDMAIIYSGRTKEADFITSNIEDVLGIPRDELKKDVRNIWKALVNKDEIIQAEDIRKLKYGEAIVSEEVEVENIVTKARRWYRIAIVHTQHNNGDSYMVAMFDKTEALNRNHQLEEVLAVAKSANEAKTNFLANMSHDFRTPMNAITGFNLLIAKNSEDPVKVREYTHKISLACQNLLSLLNDVLDMSKIESGKTTLAMSEFELGLLLEEVNSVIAFQAKGKHQDYQVHAEDIEHDVFIGDKQRINEVLVNILGNSVKYTQSGGKIDFTVSESKTNNDAYQNLKFEIKDNGLGMSEEFQQKIFEPFTREEKDTTKSIQGTGLGMAITKNLIDLMGGGISVKSKEGEGSTFVVTLRLQSVNKREDDVWAKHGIGKILVVDENKDECDMIVQAMEGTGVEVMIATSGYSALHLIDVSADEGNNFDLVLLDMIVNQQSALEIASKIKAKGEKAPKYIILLAEDWTDIEEDSRKAGIDNFMQKPFFRSTFKQMVETIGTVEGVSAEDEKLPLEGLRFLAAEDNEINADILMELMEMEGAKVELAENGKIAIEMFTSADPGYYDIVLTDIQMPVMNGYETAEAIRKLDRQDAKTIPIVAMTANAYADDVQKAFDAGMNAHVAKPIDIKNMEKVIKEVLTNAQK